jgi:hypothetical protein
MLRYQCRCKDTCAAGAMWQSGTGARVSPVQSCAFTPNSDREIGLDTLWQAFKHPIAVWMFCSILVPYGASLGAPLDCEL